MAATVPYNPIQKQLSRSDRIQIHNTLEHYSANVFRQGSQREIHPARLEGEEEEEEKRQHAHQEVGCGKIILVTNIACMPRYRGTGTYWSAH